MILGGCIGTGGFHAFESIAGDIKQSFAQGLQSRTILEFTLDFENQRLEGIDGLFLLLLSGEGVFLSASSAFFSASPFRFGSDQCIRVRFVACKYCLLRVCRQRVLLL